ncbi:MAG: hypothetical protein WAT92_02595 [Saprospiraceae bacterium]|nr:hypothetical protein [Thermoflexales bacterium]HQW33877.1 hypothetical protein [Thermoflexales bacterium]HRA00756.1 hypothetical protein [Thermoflexales bacterium]
MKDIFINAIKRKNKVVLTFFSKEDGHLLKRKCAPMDFGPSRRAKDKADRFHLWDYDSDTKVHVLSLSQNQITNIEVIDEKFDPAEFITWDTKKSPWFITREWGNFS